MNFVSELAARFHLNDYSETSGSVRWFPTTNIDLRELATYLRKAGARFVTITAIELPSPEGFCLEYLWDMDGSLYGFPFYSTSRTSPSIYDICEAADWIEREIHEEYAIDFTGRDYEPLLLRAGQLPGVNLHEVAK